MEHPLPVAAAQFAPVPDREENLRSISRLAVRVADKGARVVVFPEYSAYFNRHLGADFVEHAEPMDGPFVTHVRAVAAKHGLTVVAGFGESAQADGRSYNTVVAANPDGELVAVYRKVHLFDAFGFRESEWVDAGPLDQRPVFEVGGLSIGLQTCYDLRFPEVTRRLVDAGAEVVALPAQWVPGPFKEHHWNVLLQARAIENIVYVIAAGQASPFGVGRSAVIDPLGYVLAQTGAEEGVALADLEAPHLAAVRGNNPALELRRYTVVPAN